MDKSAPADLKVFGTLAEEAHALITATAEVAGEKVGEARKRLAAALESGKETFSRVREKAAEGVTVADRTVRDNPYQAIGLAFGVGALMGYLAFRQCCRNGD